MKYFFLLALLALVPCLAPCAEAVIPASLKAEAQDRDKASYNWMERHEAIKTRHQEIKPEYAIIGDSITHHWGGDPVDQFGQQGNDSWTRLFGNHVVTNMGFGFDYVDNAYYRIEQGELDGTSPRVVVVMIGTNNLGHRKDSPQVCADNTRALIELIRKKSPKSKILLLGVLPRREKELGLIINDTNKLLAKLANNKSVFFANPGLAIQGTEDGSIRNSCTSDGVHLTRTGYALIGDEIATTLTRIDPSFKGGKVASPAVLDGIAPEDVKLLALGDSITDNYHKASPPHEDFQPVWKKFYTPYHAVNFGISGHTTDDLLTRIGAEGILDHVSPKVVQILIGTNDTGKGATEDEAFAGIQRVVNKVRTKLPKARILLIGILPSDIYNWHVAAADYPQKKFQMDMSINDKLSRLYAKDPAVTVLDIRKVFLNADGTVKADLFCDPQIVVINGKQAGPLHPNTKGQSLMAEAIHPTLDRLMKSR